MNEGLNGDTYFKLYGANNVAHTFSRTMSFLEWLGSISVEERDNFEINQYPINDFMLGNDKKSKVKEKIFHHIPMPIHFAIKHQNQGKIESHKWFFKGFCQYMDPLFTQIIDCGSIP